ncbi:hypothetical protein [Mesorhizobium sp. B2-3-4]|uniref:phage tail assembly chaperone n=1 Tax=Mesorhizobium sp. B2-3-4 TaxID=2589959 RepID=UPI0011293791|nr:hypothetical protein [Mesorhizobium sp. B2-3-4]TPM39582.1 hypothetical protein FJ967_08855 [Mesorhizobium sp. B2-3-4]
MRKAEPILIANPDYAYLIDWFWDLSSARSMGFAGPDPIRLTDISAWSSLTGNMLLREEIGILRRLDFAFLQTLAEMDREKEGKGVAPKEERNLVEREMTPAMFGAMFGAT